MVDVFGCFDLIGAAKRWLMHCDVQELVVAAVTYGGTTYSIGPSKILGGDGQILESAVIARAKDCQTT